MNGRPPSVDPARLRESLDRLYEIYKQIATKADEVVHTRCPYKDAADRCTARFGCRNQAFSQDPHTLPTCTGSDQLDYRSAWGVY